jgi:hypothetical protein
MINNEQYEVLTQHISAVGSDIKDLKGTLANHFKDDADWKKTAEPVLQMGRNVQGFSEVIKWIVYFILSMGGIVGVIYAGIEWLKK